jgi:hypothetical protein
LPTPFDDVIEDIKKRSYHNHRLEEHSDIVCKGIFDDLLKQCKTIRDDYENGKIKYWLNVRTPGARQRRIDLLVGEPRADGNSPDLAKSRIFVENKSVVTAHRNKDARYDDLNESLQVLHRERPEAILVATVIIGTAQRVLNIPDRVKTQYKERLDEFQNRVVPRLSSGDQRLWDEYRIAISVNRASDPQSTLIKFRKLPIREPTQIHEMGYDSLLLIPMHIDNVNPPYLPKPNSLGIDVERDYRSMLDLICKDYQTRWRNG